MGDTVAMKQQKPKTLDQAADELETMLSAMVRSLVDHPADIVIHRAVNPSGFVAFEVTCREGDTGTLLGTRGKHAEAMRTLLLAASAARKIRVSVQFMSDQHDRSPRR